MCGRRGFSLNSDSVPFSFGDGKQAQLLRTKILLEKRQTLRADVGATLNYGLVVMQVLCF